MNQVDPDRIRRVQRNRQSRSPSLLHPALRNVEHSADGYRATFRNLVFIVSESREDDGSWWRHASVSRRDRKLPSYEDLQTLKKYTIGDHHKALQVFPAANDHIDIAGPLGTQVLHLWFCVDGDTLPDFTAGTGSI